MFVAVGALGGSSSFFKMSEEVRSYFRTTDVPDASVDEVVVDIDRAHKYEEVILIAPGRVVKHFVDSDKYKEARRGEGEAVLHEVSQLSRSV